MFGISERTLTALRERYPVGCRVELTHMNDPWNTKLHEGCRGTVVAVDDIGTIHITKKTLPNKGELTQFFIEDDHPTVVSRQSFKSVQEELKRRADENPKTAGSDTAFTGKIRCSCCGKNYRRKTTPYRIVWCCATFNNRGKKYCPTSKVIPEDTLKTAASEILGLTEFDEEVFAEKIDHIDACPDNLLRFVFFDGTEVEYICVYLQAGAGQRV